MKEKRKSKSGRNPKLDPAVYRYTVRFNEEEHNRFLAMFGKSGVYARSVFLKAHFFGQPFKVLKVDSVVCDFNGYPYRAVTYATQKIIRQSNVTERSLVTTCRLLNSSRSDDNPNGFTIEGFTIIENKDLQTIKR